MYRYDTGIYHGEVETKLKANMNPSEECNEKFSPVNLLEIVQGTRW